MFFWVEKQVAPLHLRENQHLGDEMLRTGYRNLTGEQPSVHIESFQSEETGPFKSTCRVLMVTHWSVQHNLLLWIHIRTKSYSCSCLHVENRPTTWALFSVSRWLWVSRSLFVTAVLIPFGGWSHSCMAVSHLMVESAGFILDGL